MPALFSIAPLCTDVTVAYVPPIPEHQPINIPCMPGSLEDTPPFLPSSGSCPPWLLPQAPFSLRAFLRDVAATFAKFRRLCVSPVHDHRRMCHVDHRPHSEAGKLCDNLESSLAFHAFDESFKEHLNNPIKVPQCRMLEDLGCCFVEFVEAHNAPVRCQHIVYMAGCTVLLALLTGKRDKRGRASLPAAQSDAMRSGSVYRCTTKPDAIALPRRLG